jgi:hypothetical protein
MIATTTTLEQIEIACKTYAETRDELRKAMQALQDQVRELSAQHRPEILAALDQAVNARLALESLVESAPSLFVKPRTKQLHGIKVGFRKNEGRVEFATSEERTITLIREKLPELAETLIKTTESVRKSNVKDELGASDLAAIGCSLVGAKDELVVAAADTDTDRLIQAMVAADSLGADLVAKAAAI